MANATEQAEIEGISQEEQEELASEIDALFTQRSELPEPTETRRKRGSTLPLLVNFVAVIVLAIGIYVVLDTGKRLGGDEDARALQTTESALVETVIAESAAEIAAREQEIQAIQDELQRLAALRVGSSDTDSDAVSLPPSERELELQAQLEELLAAVPSPASQLEQLTDLRSRQSFVLTQLRRLYQDLSVAVGSADSAATTASVAAIQSLLDSPAVAQAGLEEMVGTLSLGNDAILIAIERTALAPDASEAVLLLSQIRTLATQAAARLEAGEADAAERLYRAVIEAMDETAAAHQTLLDRQDAEFDAKTAQLNADLASLRRDLGAARRDLVAARETISVRDASIESLQETVAGQDRTIRELRDSMARRDLDSEGLDLRVAELGDELDDARATVQTLQATVAGRDTRIAALEQESTRLQGYQSRLEQLSDQVEADLRRAEDVSTPAVSGDSSSHSSVVDLLETKVQLREVVDSDPVRTRYPALYNDMELYFDAFGAEKEESGRRAAYQAASAALEGLIRSIGPSASLATVAGGSLEGYLTRLEALLTQMLAELE